jgi:hypothetical protein
MTRKLLALALVLLAAPASAVPLGDLAPGSVVYFKFNTRTAAGAPITFAGAPSLTVYKNASDAQDGGDITLTVDFDSTTGLHYVAIDTSVDPTFYASGSEYQVTVVQGTVNGQSVAGTVIASFSLDNRSALRPATAGRTLVVSAGGVADAQVKGMDADTVTASAVAADALGSSELATTARDEIVDQAWDELLSGHAVAGSTGAALTAAGGAGDPWATTASGYGASTFGGLVAALGDADIEVTAPVLEDGTISVVTGDAYDIDHAREISIALTSAPTLVGATVTLVIDNVLTDTATDVQTAGSATQTPRFELTAAQTALLTRTGSGAYRYQVQVTWAADSPSQPAVLAAGKVDVAKRAAP